MLKDIALWWAIIAAVLTGALFLVDDHFGLMVVGVSVLFAATARTVVNPLVDVDRVSSKTASVLKLGSSAVAIGLAFFAGWIVT